MQSVKIGILGLGTVGSGTVNVLTRNSKEISRRAGRDIEIARAADRDLVSPKNCKTDGIALTDDALDIINDPEIQIVVELIGGTGIARELVLKAIESGKHVVTLGLLDAIRRQHVDTAELDCRGKHNIEVRARVCRDLAHQ